MHITNIIPLPHNLKPTIIPPSPSSSPSSSPRTSSSQLRTSPISQTSQTSQTQQSNSLPGQQVIQVGLDNLGV